MTSPNGEWPATRGPTTAVEPVSGAPVEPTPVWSIVSPSPSGGATPADLPDHERRQQQQQDRAQRRVAVLLTRFQDIFRRWVRNPLGGRITVADLLAAQEKLRKHIDDEREQNQKEHNGRSRNDRQPPLLRRTPVVLAALDAVLLTWFWTKILNINWQHPDAQRLIPAALIAALITGGAYLAVVKLGDQLRRERTEGGRIPWHELSDTARGLAVGAAVATLAVGSLMGFRIFQEVDDALDDALAAAICAAVVAVVWMVVTGKVVAIAATDGSAATAKLDEIGRALRRPLAAANRLQRRADVLAAKHRLEVKVCRPGRLGLD